MQDSSTAQGSNHAFSLPEDCLGSLIKYLDLRSLGLVESLSKSWAKAVAAEDAWKSLYLSCWEDEELVSGTASYRAAFRERYASLLRLVPTLLAWVHAARQVERAGAANRQTRMREAEAAAAALLPIARHCAAALTFLATDSTVAAAGTGAAPTPAGNVTAAEARVPASEAAVGMLQQLLSRRSAQEVASARLAARHAQFLVTDDQLCRAWQELLTRGTEPRPEEGALVICRMAYPHDHAAREVQVMEELDRMAAAVRARLPPPPVAPLAAAEDEEAAETAPADTAEVGAQLGKRIEGEEQSGEKSEEHVQPGGGAEGDVQSGGGAAGDVESGGGAEEDVQSGGRNEGDVQSGRGTWPTVTGTWPTVTGTWPAVTLIREINYVLYTEWGFSGNGLDYYDSRNSFLVDVLARRTGIPISLSVVYLAVAHRLGLWLQGVNTPGHFLLRGYHRGAPGGGGESVEFFIDAFSMGRMMTLEGVQDMLQEFGWPRDRIQTAPCEPRQMFARMLRNLMSIYQPHELRQPDDPLAEARFMLCLSQLETVLKHSNDPHSLHYAAQVQEYRWARTARILHP